MMIIMTIIFDGNNPFGMKIIKQDDDTNIKLGLYSKNLGFDYIHGRPDGPSGGNVLDDIKYGLDGTKDKIKEWFNGAKNKTKDWYNGTFRPWFQNNKVLFFGICIGVVLLLFYFLYYSH